MSLRSRKDGTSGCVPVGVRYDGNKAKFRPFHSRLKQCLYNKNMKCKMALQHAGEFKHLRLSLSTSILVRMLTTRKRPTAMLANSLCGKLFRLSMTGRLAELDAHTAGRAFFSVPAHEGRCGGRRHRPGRRKQNDRKGQGTQDAKGSSTPHLSSPRPSSSSSGWWPPSLQ
mmetsp:Transcript_6097/g.12211  ORF Transcript_6097/g.12211 Transcript_6097/m.12211 type:complete len:170 (+) Transcript_6097:68-577(+)